MRIRILKITPKYIDVTIKSDLIINEKLISYDVEYQLMPTSYHKLEGEINITSEFGANINTIESLIRKELIQAIQSNDSHNS